MKEVEARVILLAETRIDQVGYDKLRRELGVPDDFHISAPSESEMLTEIGGRLCYKAFGTELNKNITKVREGNKPYIENILKQKHGSVLEHANVTFVFLNVSRILTHELVRHRAGVGISQESMRFVRLDDIPIVIPNLTRDFHDLSEHIHVISDGARKSWAAGMSENFRDRLERITKAAEQNIAEFTRHLDLEGVPFSIKKKITSALRRMAPSGHTTNIMVTGNHRAWRHMTEARTMEGAESEMRYVMGITGSVLKHRYPNMYQDMTMIMGEDGLTQCHYEYSKV